MSRALWILLAIFCIPAMIVLSGQVSCFDPELPTVAFQCGEDGECPNGYECRSDGCCYVIGSPLDTPGPCSPAPDAAVDGAAPDAALPDAALPDAALPDAALWDATPSQDAST